MSSFFTSESVSMGHPDKVSDQISDGVLDALLAQDPLSRVACETLCTTDLVVLAGEITSKGKLDYVKLVRDVVHDIGYVGSDMGFSAESVRVFVALHSQSGDIAMGVDRDGAGDQGLMFGYACNQTEELMPVPIAYAHRIINRLTDVRQKGVVDWLRPDSKSQVTVEYRDGKAVGIAAVVVSTQHSESVSHKDISDFVISEVIKKTIPAELLTSQTKYHINPTGRFVIGGPHGDTGLTGRAYICRYIAKNVVKAGLARQCEVQLSYAIGYPDPLNIWVNTNGTSADGISDNDLVELIREHFLLTPKGIIETLNLRRPIYRETARHGHFGRELPSFTWEKTDKAAALKRAAKI